MRKLIIGTRGSRLALWQTHWVQNQLTGPSQVQEIRTSGDLFTDKPLSEQDGIGFFTKEIEDELLSRKIDLAVHSLKDLPTKLAPGLVLGAILKRHDPSDLLLVSPDALDPSETYPLKRGATVGTSSLRRQALLKLTRGDLVPQPIRGNVTTRIDKARRGEYDAIIIARAGLARLGLSVEPLVAFDLNPRIWICAPGQGAIAVECRRGDTEVEDRLAALNHKLTSDCVAVERSLLTTFEGGCHAPFGAFVEATEGNCHLFLAAPGEDGTYRIARFDSRDMTAVKETGDTWITSGCPEVPSVESTEWTSRPARPWF